MIQVIMMHKKKGELLTIFRKADIINREADREVCL